MPPHVHNVLLVEDDAGTRDAMRELLVREGHAVSCARNADDARTILARNPRPCIIVLDLMMSGTSGQEFRRAQLADGAVRDIPVVLVSGVRDLAAQAHDLGVAVYLAKPFATAQLLAAIQQFCEHATAVA